MRAELLRPFGSTWSRLSRPSKAAPDFGQQGFYLERFAYHSGGAQGSGPLHVGNGDSCRDDDWNGGECVIALALLQEPPAIAVAAGCQHIQQDEVGIGAAGQLVERIVAIYGRKDREPLLPQCSGQTLALDAIVFDYHDGFASHRFPPFGAAQSNADE